MGGPRRAARAVLRRLREARRRASLFVRPERRWDGRHDPLVASLGSWRGEADGLYRHDFLGVRTHPDVRWSFRPDPPGPLEKPPPGPDQSYFELIQVLRAARDAAGRSRPFVVAELGAGYGPWLVTAHAALARFAADPPPTAMIAVEPDATHLEWLRRHLRDNGIEPDRQRVLHGAVTGEPGRVGFVPPSRPEVEYGTSVRREGAGVSLPAYTLEQALLGHERVDLLHVDVQGEEWRVLRGRESFLDARVGRLVVATHSRAVHRRLRALLRRLGWPVEFDFGFRSRATTEFGDVWFVDGMLAAVNPRAGSTT